MRIFCQVLGMGFALASGLLWFASGFAQEVLLAMPPELARSLPATAAKWNSLAGILAAISAFLAFATNKW